MRGVVHVNAQLAMLMMHFLLLRAGPRSSMTAWEGDTTLTVPSLLMKVEEDRRSGSSTTGLRYLRIPPPHTHTPHSQVNCNRNLQPQNEGGEKRKSRVPIVCPKVARISRRWARPQKPKSRKQIKITRFKSPRPVGDPKTSSEPGVNHSHRSLSRGT